MGKGTFSEKIKIATRHLDRDEHPYLLQGLLIGSFEISRIKPENLYREVLKEMKSLSLENRRALIFALGKLPLFHRSVYNNFLDKIVLSTLIEKGAPQELLVYYRGIGSFLPNLFEPSGGEWSLFLIQGLERIDEKWKEAIFWGAGFEAPLLYEDPFEYERMKQAIPKPYQPFFQQGLEDRFRWGGRNDWIESHGHSIL